MHKVCIQTCFCLTAPKLQGHLLSEVLWEDTAVCMLGHAVIECAGTLTTGMVQDVPRVQNRCKVIACRSHRGASFAQLMQSELAHDNAIGSKPVVDQRSGLGRHETCAASIKAAFPRLQLLKQQS